MAHGTVPQNITARKWVDTDKKQTLTCLKMTFMWDVALCSLVVTDRPGFKCNFKKSISIM